MRQCKCHKCALCDRYDNDPRYQVIAAAPAGGVSQFLAAMGTESAWRKRGGAGPTGTEKANRRSLCDACEKRDASNDSCILCGCYLESRLLPPIPYGKLDCSTQECPLRLWGFTGGYVPKVGCGACGGSK